MRDENLRGGLVLLLDEVGLDLRRRGRIHLRRDLQLRRRSLELDDASRVVQVAGAVRAEERRLRRIFRPLLLLSLGAPAWGAYACSSPRDDGAIDAGARVAEATADTGAADDSVPTEDDGSSDAAGEVDGGYDAGGDGRIPTCDPDADHPAADASDFLPDGDEGGCDKFFGYEGCAPAQVAPTGPGCYFSFAVCREACGKTPNSGCFVTPDNCSSLDGGNYVLDASRVVVDCTTCAGGRRPAGIDAFTTGAGRADSVGAWFARLAHLESASIAAFRTLRAELAVHDAPRELTRTAAQSARDEARHTRATGRLARKFGGSPRLARVRRGPVRALEALAVENAAEGCVRETFGALVAAHQAARAADPEVRREMARIAADELRHAALAWAVDRWAQGRLDGAGRARVAEARARAAGELRNEARAATPRSLARTAGVPSSRTARALLEGLLSALPV